MARLGIRNKACECHVNHKGTGCVLRVDLKWTWQIRFRRLVLRDRKPKLQKDRSQFALKVHPFKSLGKMVPGVGAKARQAEANFMGSGLRLIAAQPPTSYLPIFLDVMVLCREYQEIRKIPLTNHPL